MRNVIMLLALLAATPALAVNPQYNGQPGYSSYGHGQKTRVHKNAQDATCTLLVEEYFTTGSVGSKDEAKLADCLAS